MTNVLATDSVREVPTFRVEDTNIDAAINLAEKFSAAILGVTVTLRKQFDMPTELPWKNVLLVFDPGLNNREALKRAIQSQLIDERESVDIMKFSGSEALAQPTLHVIENSIRPSSDTLGVRARSPYELGADECPYLNLRGYIIAFGQRHFGFRNYLDIRTQTWFPENLWREVVGDRVTENAGIGCWRPSYDKLCFSHGDANNIRPSIGARLVVNVPLRG